MGAADLLRKYPTSPCPDLGAWRRRSAPGRHGSFEKFKNASPRLLGCANVVTIDHLGSAPVLLGKPVQMFAVPAMSCVWKDVPLYGRACRLCRLKLWNTFTSRRLSILVAHQDEDRTINIAAHNFEVWTSQRFDRETTG